MASRIASFLRDERGMEEVEIAVVAGLLVLVGALIFIQIGNDSETILGALEAAVSLSAGS